MMEDLIHLMSIWVILVSCLLDLALGMMDQGRFATWDPVHDQPRQFSPGVPPPSFVFAPGQNAPPYDIDSQSLEPYPGCSAEYATLCAVQLAIRLVTRTKQAVCDSLTAGGVARATVLAGVTDGLYRLDGAEGFEAFVFSASSGEVLADALRPDLVGQRLDCESSSGHYFQPDLLSWVQWVISEGSGGFLPHYSTRFSESDGNTSSANSTVTADRVVSYIEACASGDVIATSFKRAVLPPVERCSRKFNSLCATQNLRSIIGSVVVDLLTAHTAEKFSRIAYDIMYTSKYKAAGFSPFVYELGWLGYPGSTPPVPDSQSVGLADGDGPTAGLNLTDLDNTEATAEFMRSIAAAAWEGGSYAAYTFTNGSSLSDGYPVVSLAAGVIWNNTGRVVITYIVHQPEAVLRGLSCEECPSSGALPCTLVNTENLVSHVHTQALIPSSTWSDIAYDPWFGAEGPLSWQNEYVGMWPSGFTTNIVDFNGTMVSSSSSQDQLGLNITEWFPYPSTWGLHLEFVYLAEMGGGWLGMLQTDRPSGPGRLLYAQKIQKNDRSFYLASFALDKAWGPWDSTCSAASASRCSSRNGEVIVGAAMGDILASRSEALRALAFEDIALRQGPYAPSETNDFSVLIYDSNWKCHDVFLSSQSLGKVACPPQLSNDQTEKLESALGSGRQGWAAISKEDGEYAFVARIRWRPLGRNAAFEELYLMTLIGAELAPPTCNTSADCPAHSTCSSTDGRCHCWSGYYKNQTVSLSECGGFIPSGMQCINLAGLDCLGADNKSIDLDTCKPCSAGFFCSAGRPTSCSVGQYCPPGSSLPHPCPAGSIASESGHAVCDPCAPGTYAPGAGSDACMACSSGSFAQNVGQTSCTICEVGSYSNVSGAESCSQCLGGATTIALGAMSQSECRYCRPEHMFYSTTDQACLPCAWGSITSSLAATDCHVRDELVWSILVFLCFASLVGVIGVIFYRRFRKHLAAVLKQESEMLDKLVANGIEAANDFLSPMVVMSFRKFADLTLDELKQGHEGNRDAHRLTWIDTLNRLQELQRTGVRVVVLSFPQSMALDQTPTGRQLAAMKCAIEEVSTQNGWSKDSVFVWMDTFSISKDFRSVAELGIQSMYLFAKSADAFVVVTPSQGHADSADEYGASGSFPPFETSLLARFFLLARACARGGEQVFTRSETLLQPASPTWLASLVQVFRDCQAECCQPGHSDVPCQCRALITPLLGLYYDAIKSEEATPGRIFVQEVVAPIKDLVFPRTILGTLGPHSRKQPLPFFGDLVSRMDNAIARKAPFLARPDGEFDEASARHSSI